MAVGKAPHRALYQAQSQPYNKKSLRGMHDRIMDGLFSSDRIGRKGLWKKTLKIRKQAAALFG